MRARGERRWRPLAAGAVVVSLGLVAAACSSGSSGSGGSAGSAGTVSALPNNTEGVTSSQITIGATTPETGPAAPGYDEIAPAADAYFKYVNAHGGVNGRTINYIVENDQYDPSMTASLTRQLVLQDHIFADVGPLGTPTFLAVKDYLNTEKVPAVFVESGCNCWSQPSTLPLTFGWQPPYTVEGKILGQYITQRFSGMKIGYLSQDDEFGQDGVKGLDQKIPSSDVVSRQTYTATTQALAAGLGSQVDALKAAGAQVVVLYSIPAATALTLLAAAEIGYHPDWVVSSTGSDVHTLSGLLASFSKGQAGASLLNGMITDTYLPVLTDSSNSWVTAFKSILAKYDPGAPWDGNSEYGLSLAYTFVQALQAAGKNLTRSGLVNALQEKGKSFMGPGIVPLTYSSSVHFGYQGGQLITYSDNGSTQTTVGSRYQATITGPISPVTTPLSTAPTSLGS
jgi:branched-chain amino acid transport system substrate-binding protein